jgi:hypothetical protein
MGNDGIGAPLSRRVPGEARPGPGQPVRPVLPESVLNRMQAAIDAEHAHVEGRQPGEPNTEPLPRVTAPGSPSKRGAKRAPSPSGVGPDFEPVADQAAKPEGVARPPRAARSPRADEPLRVGKALRATEAVRAAEEQRAAEELRAASAARVQAAEPEPVRAAEPEPLRAAKAPHPAEPPYAAQPPRGAEPPSGRGPTATAAFETGPTPGSIGWLWPEETATRGGGGGGLWQPPRRWNGGGGWRYRTATLVALGAVLLAAAGLVIGLSLHSTPVAAAAHGKSSLRPTAPAPKADSTPATTTPAAISPPAPDPAIAPNLASAAAWIAQQVAPGTVVACDAQTCAALTASGIPAAQQVQLAVNPQSLSGAGIIVLTPAVRTLLTTTNPGLVNYVTPPVLASFGQVTVHLVYPAGRAAYQTALSQDVQERIQLGTRLLNSGLVSASSAAESELTAGTVDPRLLLAIQALANQQPIDIVGFGDSGPVAGPGTPFRGVDLAETDISNAMSPTGYVQSMIALLKAHATFPAFASGRQVALPDGQTVVEVVYAAPSPLGLLAP